MKNDPDLLASAKLGFAGKFEHQGMFSSPIWLACHAGAALANRGGSEPARVCMSRGYAVRIESAGGIEFLIKFSGENLEQTDVQRMT